MNLIQNESKSGPATTIDADPVNMTEFRLVRPEAPAPVSMDGIFDCLIHNFRDGDSFQAGIVWLNLSEVVKTCRAPANQSVIFDTFFGAEPKFMIPGPTPDFEYTMLTFGVGRSVKAEEMIMHKYKNCKKFVAVDPTAEVNEKLVTDAGGRFLELTVGAKDDVFAASIMQKPLGNRLPYITKNVTHTSIESTIKKAEMGDIVDIMLMDIEGAEFEILENFIDQSVKRTTICQMNVEMHSPWVNVVKKNNIIRTLYNLSKKREWMLFEVNPVKIRYEVFHRSFFINVKDPYCVQKYYPSMI
uniref:Methyltransf_21 domain-containing protein n=1 Tax=Panagrellus redivivus TaxID=6233 RepID=A0A7E4VCB9_PANRE